MQPTEDVGVLHVDLGSYEDWVLVQHYRRYAPAYFGRLVRRLRILEPTTVADMLDDAVAEGRLTEAEREAVLLADLVATGQRREDQAEVYVLVEVSVGIGPHDVERAAERAAMLAKLGRRVVPIVAGQSSTREADTLALERGVWRVLDGRATPPAAS